MTKLIPVSSYLGKYYPELKLSTQQEKYAGTNLDNLFGQRFGIQGSSAQMIVDPLLSGLQCVVMGSEISVSKELYDHPDIYVLNSLENVQSVNPRSLYDPSVFSTFAYLICSNHVTFHIVGKLDKPIYVKLSSEYETFYNSVVVFNVDTPEPIEIVEEIESKSAINSVLNYLLRPSSNTKITTFYRNNIASLSTLFRYIIAQDSAKVSHTLFGKGSANVLDETRLSMMQSTVAEVAGCVDSGGRQFHSVLIVDPKSTDYKITVDYRNLTQKGDSVSYFPAVIGENASEHSSISVNDLAIDRLPEESADEIIVGFIKEITDRKLSFKTEDTDRVSKNLATFLKINK